MTGTGFLDNWKAVDTSKDVSEQTKQVNQDPKDLPSTSSVSEAPVYSPPKKGVSVSISTLEEIPIEALVDEEPAKGFLESEGVIDFDAETSGEWSLPQSSNPAWKELQHLDPHMFEIHARFCAEL